MEAVEQLRPRAFAIAYRMLGSVSEAEDVVQEALLRLHRAEQEGERIESPLAYLSTVVTRLAIDELRSARARRERYATEFFRDWDKVANDTVALLRAEAGRDPYDRQLSDLIGELSTRSNEFRVRWAAHNVRSTPPA